MLQENLSRALIAMITSLAMSVGAAAQISSEESPSNFGGGATAAAGGGGGGETNGIPEVDWILRQGVDSRLQSDGVGLMGEQIDLNSGSIVFSHVDVSLPGNSHLEVAFRRRRTQGSVAGYGYPLRDWDIEAPRLTSYWVNPSNPPQAIWDPFDCLNFNEPWDAVNFSVLYEASEWWNGTNIEIPGGGGRTVLNAVGHPTVKAGTTQLTTDHWELQCVSGVPGGKFYATAPNGDVYRFDRRVNRTAKSLRKGSKVLPRKQALLLATEVTDVNGNWVRYNYDASNHLTQISSSDGRVIDIAYSGSDVVSVTANGRTWTYAYGTIDLSSVTLPDGRRWTFSLGAMDYEARGGGCTLIPNQTATVTHPNGVTGTFTLADTKHGRTYVPSQPIPDPEQAGCGEPYQIQRFFRHMSVVQKSLSGAGYPTANWSYSYGSDNGAFTNSGGLPDAKWTQVIDPTGRKTVTWHNRRWGDLEGLATQEDIFASAGASSPLQSTATAYAIETDAGTTDLFNDNLAKTTKPRHPATITITRGSDSFTTRNTYVTDRASASYSFGFPTKVERWSNLQAEIRVADTVYAHDRTKWVLGLPGTVTRNGKLFDSFSYDSFGRVLTKSEFGQLRWTFTYNADGTIATIKDSHNHVHTPSNWKRGRPQNVLLPNGDTISRVIDNNGWVTSETDGRGVPTSYSYNSMGWLTAITRLSPFNPTTISYSGLGSGLTAVETRGAKKTTISYDGLLRVTLVKTEATDGSATTNYVKTDYDGLGRTIFQSWPSASASPTPGISTSYDALDRVTSVGESGTPYATTTEYLSGGQTRVTDPENAVVTTTFRAFGSPDEAEPISIVDAMGATTTMTRDIYGNVATLAQSGTQNGYSTSVTRTFWYDSNLRLCRHRAPEFGDEVFLYDSEGQLIESGRGAAAASGCASSIATSIKVAHAYDARHRETGVTFPAGTPSITRVYDENSNVTKVTRAGGGVWDYTYTTLNGLASEQLVIDGRTYMIGHAYNANGDVTMRSNSHSGVLFDFSANAFGQPRAITNAGVNYVSGAAYHPNGVLASAAYGNGYQFEQTLNDRQLTTQLKTSKSGAETAVWLTYDHRPRRQIWHVIDSDGAGSDESRTFTYDPNGRLLTATGPWGSGSYVYDALGNLRGWTEGARNMSIAYDAAANRVSQANLDGWIRSFSYDARGNTANDGRNAFAYDFANQPTALTGPGAASYAYDGNLKRVKEVRGGKTIYTVYSRLTGGLVYRDEMTDNVKTDYASAGGAALRLKKTGNGSFVPEYTHFDSLGSPVAATNAAGAVLWRESYTPFGSPRLNPAGNSGNTNFTGHLRDPASGLVYMQARYYDPLIGRFYSTDPIGYQDQLNLYAYVANDPVNLVDPFGLTSGEATEGREPQPDPRNVCHGFLGCTKEQRGASNGRPIIAAESFFMISRLSTAGAAGLAADDVTGIGIADDVLIPPALVVAAVAAGAGVSIQVFVHANSLASQRQTTVYEVYLAATGATLKYGITSNPLGSRYSANFYSIFGARSRELGVYPNRASARAEEIRLCTAYIAANGYLPPLSLRC